MKEILKIPEIVLNWSQLYSFEDIKKHAKEGGVNIPNQSGVYKVLNENNEILHIGRASNLRHRIKQGFVKGKTPHSTRDRMLNEGVDFKKLKIQWAITDWPNSAEEYLHKKFKKEYGHLPKFTKVT